MLHEFLTLHRDEIIARTRAKVGSRNAPRATDEELEQKVKELMPDIWAKYKTRTPVSV